MSGPTLTIARAHDELHVNLKTRSLDRERPIFDVKPASLIKVQPGQEAAALAVSKADGADNIIVKLGKDTYVASGRNLDKAHKAHKGDAVRLLGETGEVLHTNYELNSFRDGAKRAGWAAGGVVAGATTLGIVLAAKGSKGMIAGMWRHSPKIAIAAGAVVLAGGIYGAVRSVNYGATEAFAKR
jgi:hypothetical protein